MKGKHFEIVILSGKGGTGKTSLVAALAYYAGNVVFADADVDAADLHLVFRGQTTGREDFPSGTKAVINPDTCTACGICEELCRFRAIRSLGDNYRVEEYACEGCGLCVLACPAEAIRLVHARKNQVIRTNSRFGPMVYGKLYPGEENSGKLVSRVRKIAGEIATEGEHSLILVDGPPGIGCPAISAVTGTDLVIAVTEPGLSGWHDLERLLQMTAQFRATVWVVINKADLHPGLTEEIRTSLEKKGIPVVATIPWESEISQALLQTQSLPEASPDHPVSKIYLEIWEKIVQEASMAGKD